MLLIRPWLRMNKYRVTGHHVIFFIFIISNVGGCLTPIGDAAADITVSDQVHITEKGSVFLIASIIDRLLGGEASASKPR